mmetsp:Transcript_41709/g.91569  ORF Transcript_41709/g.91569 Transcript_41709/m.91569 type:complete len:152 (-) Transcript_41709:825-1280(-)
MPTPLSVPLELEYPRIVRLYHGKHFKIGVDFLVLKDGEYKGKVCIVRLHEGYPAIKCGAVKVGDVVSKVNDVEVDSIAGALEQCKCKGGRGTDEVVEVTIIANASAHVPADVANAPAAKEASSPIAKLTRSLSFSKKSKAGKSKRNVWEDD